MKVSLATPSSPPDPLFCNDSLVVHQTPADWSTAEILVHDFLVQILDADLVDQPTLSHRPYFFDLP